MFILDILLDLNRIDLLFDNLVELKVDFNRLTSLPPCLGRCSRLQYLSFQNNQIGTLPDEFEGLKNLREINMGYNKFVTKKALFIIFFRIISFN